MLNAVRLVTCTLLLFPTIVLGQDADQIVQWDPTTIDQLPIDEDAPPAMRPVGIPSADARLLGHMYIADGPGPHATVVLLRDFPGWDTNSDVAQALRRAGYNALIVNYRGSWGTGGDFSWGGAAEDVGATIDYLRSSGTGELYRVDPERIHLLGDGFGAWAAVAGAAGRDLNGCIAATGMWNPGLAGRQLSQGESGSRIRNLIDSVTSGSGGPIRADSEVLLRELSENTEALELAAVSAGVRGNSLLVLATPAMEVAPEQQTMGAAVAFSAAGATTLERSIINDDVDFSAGRVRLARTIVSWFERRCPAW